MLWQEARLAASRAARFHTRSGLLTATREDDRIVLDFPAETAAAAPAPPGLLDALGVEARWIGRNRMDYLVEVAPESVVRGLAPDLVRLATVPTRGVIVTSASAGPHDFVSRFFAPRAGIPEDPVTGSAHCCLGPYWRPRVGRDSMAGYQASPRGGEVRVRVAGDRVHLGGRAVTVLRGHLV